MERTQNARVKLVTFACYLDLESASLSYGFCTPSHCDEHQSLMKIFQKFRRYGADTKVLQTDKRTDRRTGTDTRHSYDPPSAS